MGQPSASGTELEPDVGQLSFLHGDAVLEPAEALLEVADFALEPRILVESAWIAERSWLAWCWWVL